MSITTTSGETDPKHPLKGSSRLLKNRSRVEIMFGIISAAKPYAKKTHLMYRSNLSYQQLEVYLSFIMENELLEEKNVSSVEGGTEQEPQRGGSSRFFVVTQKGLDFLKLFQELNTLIAAHSAGAEGQQDRVPSIRIVKENSKNELKDEDNAPVPPLASCTTGSSSQAFRHYY